MGIRTELNLRLPNSPGAAAAVCQLLADERVNIIAMSLDAGGQFHLVVDNHTRAIGALRNRHHIVTEHPVIFASVSNNAGGLPPVLRLLSEAGINVEYAYGAGPEGSAGACVVLGVDDAQRAAAAAGV